MRKLLPLLALLAIITAGTAQAQTEAISVANEAITGTTIGKLAKFTATSPVTAVIATTSDTDGVVGIVAGFSLQGSTGVTGNAYISQVGITNCTFDTSGVTTKHYVIASTAAGGSCADGGATRPSGVQVIGIAQATGGSGASVAVQMDKGFATGGGSFANPTATIGTAAVNGAAVTAMRSDAAPAIPQCSASTFGACKVDGTTITASAGVISSTGASTGVGVQAGQAPLGMGDNATALAAAHFLYFTNAAFTAARSKNLPDSVTQGVGNIEIYDRQGTLTSSNTLTLCAAGTDTLNGTPAGCITPLDAAYSYLELNNDGAGKWTTGAGATVASGGTNGQLLVGATGANPAWKTLSQDCTLTSTGVITCLKTNNVSFGTAATVNTGTSGATIPLLNGTNTFGGTQTFGAVVGTINTQSGTSYTLAATDCGKTVLFTSGSPITLTTLNSIPAGCNIAVEQGGAGQITVTAGSGATQHSAHSYTKTFAQYAIIGLFVDTNSGAAADFIITGDGA